MLFFFTVERQNIITEKTDTYAHEITVEGFQWSWQFGYPEAGTQAVVTGTPAQPPTLVVPLGEREVHHYANMSCTDSGSSFHDSMQYLPGVTNELEFTATKLGEFPGRCNILCGRNHSKCFSRKVVHLMNTMHI